ncbi:VanZ family protein [Ruminococcaceae bacterium OttesenSCG-928-A16]|nr:VanZ family protein [Ruminococcaceae bacterium OttesenSCG-928-A16]
MTLAYTLNLALTMLVFVPVYILLRWLYRKKRPTPAKQISREVLLALFAVFLAAFATQVFSPGAGFTPATLFSSFWHRLQTGTDINLIPFKSNWQFVTSNNWEHAFLNLAGNVLIFSPIGFFLPLLWQRWQRFYKVALCGLAFTCFIEFSQLFIARYTDVDDIILNVLGTMLGYGVYALLRHMFPSMATLASQKHIKS